MTMDLAYWQKRLETHFSKLSADRKREAPDRGIFGLEHGLGISEVQTLAAAVRAHIAERSPSRDHVLPWVVYSAELGYRYSGDEYWQTFEEETPGWIVNGYRDWIRSCYLLFQKNFCGVVPSGAWAKHFSIICWPITHAILPRDLQQQLARILYELRDSFSAELLESPSTLGELIAARSWNASSRFQNLAQETQLVGQIAAALLLQGGLGTSSLIHPVTLGRIGEDLDRERMGREWLRSARRFARERAHIRGLGSGRKPLSTVLSPEEARAEVTALGIEPRLVLRPTDVAGNSWDVSLEIPDLSHLLLRFPRVCEILTGSRCIVAGAAGRPLARGRCLHGSQRITLARWPREDEVLLQFEQTDPQLKYLLRTECLLRPGPSWLFRIATDEFAYECRSLGVRPNERYIIVNTISPVESNEHVRPIDIQCKGAYGALLNLPPALDREWEETLRRLSLRQKKTIDVWPAGLTAAMWDGEGRGEWLASEQPCLAIRTDHPIASLLISIGNNAGSFLKLTSVKPGEPIFVELPQLPVGLHTVHVSAQSSLEGEAEPLGDLDVVMRIREARPWSPGISPHGPLLVQVHPTVPTLEQFWEGRVEVMIQGPVDRNVKCRISLFKRDGDPSLVTKQLPPMRLPVTANGWRNHFEKHFRKLKDVEEAYDFARVCKFEFSAEELGGFTVRCEREFEPLRWVLRRRDEGYFVRLLDDSGYNVQPETTRMAFETPCVEEKIKYTPEYEVPEAGGMYVARTCELIAAIIVPPVVRELADLRCVPHVDVGTRSTESIIRALEIARLWGRAKLPGNLFSVTRRRDVLLALTSRISRLLWGESWIKAENFARENDGIEGLKDAISKRPQEKAVGVVLERDCADLAAATCKDRVNRIASLATSFHLLPSAAPSNETDAVWLSELALRLSSDPVEVVAWAGQHLGTGITRLLEFTTLGRAARYLVLATNHYNRLQVAPGELYAGWRWT